MVRWVAVSVLDDAMWHALGDAEGLASLSADPRFATVVDRTRLHDEIDQKLCAWTSVLTNWEAASELQHAGVAAAPVLDSWDVIVDDQLAARDFYRVLPSARFGADLNFGSAVVLPDTPIALPRAAPAMGEHTCELLADLGHDADDVERLLGSGVASAMTRTEVHLERRWLGDDLIGWAMSGVLPSIGDPDLAPLAPPGGLADRTASLNAAVGTMIALRVKRRTGRGQVVDISMQEAVMSVGMEMSPVYVLDTGARQERTGKRRPTPPMGHYPTKDGAVTIIAFTGCQWDALASWISEKTGITEVTLDLFGGTPAERAPYIEAIDAWIEDLTMRFTKQEFSEEAQRRGIPCTR